MEREAIIGTSYRFSSSTVVTLTVSTVHDELLTEAQTRNVRVVPGVLCLKLMLDTNKSTWLTSLAYTGLLKGTNRTKDPIVQELCESRGGRPGLSVLTSLLVSVDVKLY